MAKYNEMDEARRKEIIDHINQRWGQLYELEKETGERALKYLLMTNAGGAVATLSFLGTSEVARALFGVKLALFLFVVGVVLVGVSNAMQFHHMSHLFKSYKKDVDLFYQAKLGWMELSNNDDGRAVEKRRDIAVPYISFGCFIWGCIVGAFSLFS